MKGVEDVLNGSYVLNENVQNTVSKYSHSIIRIAFNYVKNTSVAEDISQDVFLTYMQKLPRFESDEHEKAWFIRITINKSKNYFKAGWFRNRNALPDNLSYLPKEESEILNAVLESDERYRLPIHLFYYEGYSIQEIADILKAKPATVGTWLARGRVLLKGKIGGFENE